MASSTGSSTSGGCSKTNRFLESGSADDFVRVLSLYDEALQLKAKSKSSKPENVIKLDKWYQNELPKKIKSRGKDAHLTHDELVQTIKWKLARGKFRPNLTNLVQMNTPRVVVQVTKKAIRNIFKRNDIAAGMAALCNLKGVGPAMASAVLAAGAPHLAPFMADECLWAMPDVDCLDYTMKEYMKYVDMVNQCVDRLNQGGGSKWTPHKVELAVWTYYILNDLKPERLTEMAEEENNINNGTEAKNKSEEENNGNAVESAEDSNPASSLDESSNPPMIQSEDSNSQNSLPAAPTNGTKNEEESAAEKKDESESKKEESESKKEESESKKEENGDQNGTSSNTEAESTTVVKENGNNGNGVAPEGSEDSSSMPNPSSTASSSEENSSSVCTDQTKNNSTSEIVNNSCSQKRPAESETNEPEGSESKKAKTCESNQEAVATA